MVASRTRVAECLCLAAVVVGVLTACGSRQVEDRTCASVPTVGTADPVDGGDHRRVEVRFRSGCEVLAGTLYLPPGPGPHPAMVFVHGSGRTPRLGIGGGWITTPLIEAGVAVLSYDKRGVGESEGRCCPGRDGDFDLLAADVEAAIDVLRAREDIDAAGIGLLGVSQAGWVIPIVAERSVDVAYTVVFSGSGVSVGEEILYSNLTGEDESTPPETPAEEIESRLEEAGPSGFDPRPFLRAYRVPALWIFGARDQSHPSLRAASVLEAMAAEEDKQFTVEVFDHLGHDPTHDPQAIALMLSWLDEVVQAS